MEDPQVKTALRQIGELNRGNVKMVAELNGCSEEETAEWLSSYEEFIEKVMMHPPAGMERLGEALYKKGHEGSVGDAECVVCLWSTCWWVFGMIEMVPLCSRLSH